MKKQASPFFLLRYSHHLVAEPLISSVISACRAEALAKAGSFPNIHGDDTAGAKLFLLPKANRRARKAGYSVALQRMRQAALLDLSYRFFE